MRKNADQINWYDESLLIKVSSFSQSFFERFKGEINWWRLTLNSNLTEDFIVKNIEHLHCWELSRCHGKKVPEYLLEKYFDRFDAKHIASYHDVSPEFILRHSDEKKWWKELSFKKVALDEKVKDLIYQKNEINGYYDGY